MRGLTTHKLRSVNTHFWDDAYTANLDPVEKLMFLYFLTNPLTNLAGVYEIPIRRIAFDTGMDKDMVLKILERFEKDKKIFYRKDYIILANFYKNQKYNTDMEKNRKSILGALPTEILRITEELRQTDSLSQPVTPPRQGKGREGEVEDKVEVEVEDKEKLWRSIFLKNPGKVEFDFVDELVIKFGLERAKEILYNLRENNFHSIRKMKDSLDESGNIKPFNSLPEKEFYTKQEALAIDPTLNSFHKKDKKLDKWYKIINLK